MSCRATGETGAVAKARASTPARLPLVPVVLPAPEIPGSASKPNETSRKYQSGISSEAVAAPKEGQDSLEVPLAGVGTITDWFAAGRRKRCYGPALADDRY